MTTMVSERASAPCGEREPPPRADCTCGCEGPCRCGPECLERPAFHPGQLLTADTLRLGQQYVERRFALRRYIDGVGVVCGLDLHCDPSDPGVLVVEPGYAVDCCGNDLVVCDAVRVDVCACVRRCPKQADPCDPDPTDTKDEVRQVEKRTAYVIRLEREVVGRDPVPVIVGRGQCTQRATCAPSKERLGVRVCLEPADQTGSDAEVVARTRAFQDTGRDVIAAVVERVGTVPVEADNRDAAIGVAVADGLLTALHHKPAHLFCAIRRVVCDVRNVLADALPEIREREREQPQQMEVRGAARRLARMLLALIDDRRHAALFQACDDCCVRTGVALGEVWVEPASEAPDTGCALTAIDIQPPARDVLRPRSRWWHADRVSLYDAYFRDVREACVLLSGRGLAVEAQDVSRLMSERSRDAELTARLEASAAASTGLQALVTWLTGHDNSGTLLLLELYRLSDLYAPCQAQVVLWTLGGRVVAIRVGGVAREPGTTIPGLGSPRGTFGHYLRYAVEVTAQPASGPAVPRPPREAPDPLIEMIDGIGRKTEAALFRSGITSLEQLVEIEYESVNDFVSPVLLNFRRETFEGWRDQAVSLLSAPKRLAELRRKAADSAAKRLVRVRKEGA